MTTTVIARTDEAAELMKIQLDEYISGLSGRELVSTSEVIDVLLDLRNTFFVPALEEPSADALVEPMPEATIANQATPPSPGSEQGL